MKKFLSFVLALTLLVSLFAVTVAFADTEGEGNATTPVVTIDNALLKDKVLAAFPEFKNSIVSDGSRDLLDWISSKDSLSTDEIDTIFAGINYRRSIDNVKDSAIKREIIDVSDYTTDSVTTDSVVTVKANADGKFVKLDDGKWYEAKLTCSTTSESHEHSNTCYDFVLYIECATGCANARHEHVDIDGTTYTVYNDKYDKICVEYYTPSQDREGDGTTVSSGTVKFSTVGMWSFRYVVKSNDGEDVYGKSDFIHVQIADQTAPQITPTADSSASTGTKDEENSNTIYYTKKESAEKTGLTAGTNFSVKSYSYYYTVEDTSSISYTYVIKKLVNGAWTEIYNSTDKVVAEGYEDYVTTGGTITPKTEDITGSAVYQIVYTIKDANGYVGVNALPKVEAGKTSVKSGSYYISSKFSEMSLDEMLTLNLAVNEPTKTDSTDSTSGVSAWKIILYVIAGLSAAGIVVLLVVKPRDAQPAQGGRIHYGAASEQPVVDDVPVVDVTDNTEADAPIEDAPADDADNQ